VFSIFYRLETLKVLQIFRRGNNDNAISDMLWKMLQIPGHEPCSSKVSKGKKGQVIWVWTFLDPSFDPRFGIW
jgi:hypothetical protein